MDVRASPRAWRSARYPRSDAGIRVRQRPEPSPVEEGDAVQEVGPVAAHGVLRGPPLRGQVPEERRHGGAALLTAGRFHALSVSRR